MKLKQPHVTESTLIVFAAALALLLLVAGCSTSPESGIVTGADHRDAYTSLSYCGKNCWAPIHHAERWRLHITNGNESGWRTVDIYAYNNCPVGSTWPNCTWSIE